MDAVSVDGPLKEHIANKHVGLGFVSISIKGPVTGGTLCKAIPERCALASWTSLPESRSHSYSNFYSMETVFEVVPSQIQAQNAKTKSICKF